MSVITYVDDLYWKKEKAFLKAYDAEFVERINNKELTNYEVLVSDTLCYKLYLDFDMTAVPKEKFTTELCEQIEQKCLSIVSDELQYYKPTIHMATSHTATFVDKHKVMKTKISVRLYVSNIAADKQTQLIFVKKINRKCFDAKDQEDSIFKMVPIDTGEGRGVFDIGIYDSNRKMRCVNSSKPNENRPLILKMGTIEGTIISSCFDSCIKELSNKTRIVKKKIIIGKNACQQTQPSLADTDRESVSSIESDSKRPCLREETSNEMKTACVSDTDTEEMVESVSSIESDSKRPCLQEETSFVPVELKTACVSDTDTEEMVESVVESAAATPVEMSHDSDEAVSTTLTKNQQLVRLIKIGKSDRAAWLTICANIKHNRLSENDWLAFCEINQLNMDSEKIKLFKNVKTDKAMPIYYLQWLAKKSNPVAYQAWLKTWKVYYIAIDNLEDPYLLANHIKPTLIETLVFCKEQWYMLDEHNLWKQQKAPAYYITTEIRKYIDELACQNTQQIQNTPEGEAKEALKKITKRIFQAYKTIQTSQILGAITNYLKALLADNKFSDKLDATKGVLAFSNGVMDLESKIFRKGIFWTDYLTDTIHYPYMESNFDFIKSVLLKILNNNKEHLEYFLSIIGYCFIGQAELEKAMFFAVDKTDEGKGDNGKTFFFEIMSHLMPCYVYNSKSSLLDKKNTKVHKQLSVMKGKLLVWMDELVAESELNAVLMKELANGNSMENEVMFGTSEKIPINFKVFGLTNHVPPINSKEQAAYNRFRQISFNSHFDRTGERTMEHPTALEFIADCGLSKRIKEHHYDEVFNMIIHYANKYYCQGIPQIPQQFAIDTMETKAENDKFGCWFKTFMERNTHSKVAISQIMLDSRMPVIEVKRGMKLMGFKYVSDLAGFGQDPKTGKYFKGGYKGVRLLDGTDYYTY